MGQIPHERIVSDPDIMMGKPTIKGTRITVELILTKLGEGMSMAELLEAYPHLTSDDVHAALSFAADYLRNEDIQFGQPEAAWDFSPRMSRWSSGGGASTRRSRRLGRTRRMAGYGRSGYPRRRDTGASGAGD